MTSATCMQVPTTTTTGEVQPDAGACVASAGIVGGSGYTGALLAELLLRHPSVKLAAISSETLAGEPVQQHLPRLRSEPGVLQPGRARRGGRRLPLHAARRRGADRQEAARRRRQGDRPQRRLPARRRDLRRVVRGAPASRAAPRRVRPHRAAPGRGGRGGPGGQPRLLPDGGAAGGGPAQAARPRRRDHRRQVGRERRRQDAQVRDPLLQRRLGPRRLRRAVAPALPGDRRRARRRHGQGRATARRRAGRGRRPPRARRRRSPSCRTSCRCSGASARPST